MKGAAGCGVHQSGVVRCAMAGRRKQHEARSARTSVSLPRNIYLEVQRIARRNRVSTAWVIRDAVEKYVGNEAPLFSRAPGA